VAFFEWQSVIVRNNVFVEVRGLLKAGHAAHPQCWADNAGGKH
jgi:hypothetical protein